MKFLFVIDPIKNINPLKDSTAALMQATDLRNIEVWFCTPQDLEARADEVWASSTKTKPNPSQVDKSSCERSRVPWYIVSPQTGLWGECHPTGKDIPYVGRPFIHGLDDCYSLVRDWYQKELNIKLNDYFRQNEWWYKGENLYLDNFAKEGFREIKEEELRYGDLLLMCIVSNVPNHAAIFLEGNIVLHHVQGRLSSRDVYSGYYRKATAKRLRHESR